MGRIICTFTADVLYLKKKKKKKLPSQHTRRVEKTRLIIAQIRTVGLRSGIVCACYTGIKLYYMQHSLQR